MTEPINLKNLDLFYGRSKELIQIEKLLNIYGIAIIEGDYGIGKTSLGNFYRFKNSITPLNEISTNPNWDTISFLHEVLKNITEFLYEEKDLQLVELVKKLNLRYDINQERSLNPNILGNSIGYSSKPNKEEIITEAGLIYDLRKLGEIALKNNKKIIIQLNNLDVGKTMSIDDILGFFAKNRNIFHISNIFWILTGSNGLTNSFKKDLPKFGSIIGSSIILEKLKEEEIKNLILKRNFSIEEKYLNKMIQSKNNDLRGILNLLEALRYEDISSYFNYFSFSQREKDLLYIIKNDYCSQKEISKDLSVSLETVRKYINSLMLNKAIDKKGSKYTCSFEAFCSLGF